MAELADALASGASGGNLVQVQLLLSAPAEKDFIFKMKSFFMPSIRQTASIKKQQRSPLHQHGQSLLFHFLLKLGSGGQELLHFIRCDHDVLGQILATVLGDENIILQSDSDAFFLYVESRFHRDDHTFFQNHITLAHIMGVQTQVMGSVMVVVLSDFLILLDESQRFQLPGIDLMDQFVDFAVENPRS